MINIRFITTIIGKLLLIESAFLLLSLIVALIYGESDSIAFLISTLITASVGTAMTFSVKIHDRVLVKKDGYLVVSMIWIIFSIFGSLPFILGGTIPSFVDAFFETMSGFTTTGSSILNDIESLPHASLFWRSITQWLGGMGIIVLFIAILPALGIEGRDLFVAEVPGPTTDKITASFASTARRLWIIYTLFTILQSIALYLGGMSIFDSICHSFTTMATGGYSTKQASIAHWDSAYIQYVFIIFMFIAGTNFGLTYSLICGKFKKFYKEQEFRAYLSIIAISTLIITVLLSIKNIEPIEQNFRDSLFQVISILTTTGFITADYMLWTPLAMIIIFGLMFIGGSAGSTAGGMKVTRISLLMKNSVLELKRIIHPNAVINVKHNNKSVNSNIMTGVMAFTILFIIVFCVGTLIMTILTEDIETSASAVITSLANVGPGFGAVGPMNNFASLGDISKLFLSLLMLIGRLEVLTVLVIFTKAFWKE